jgi:NAD(P)-dependent dehydrogenase (short-subunit alcohol dehydrogenase family)
MQSKIAFISGANRGLGFETARELGEKGIKVIMGSRDKTKGDVAAKKLKDKGFTVEAFEFDINNFADHKKLFAYLEKNGGKLDILVNNAGIFLDKQASGRENRTSTIDIKMIHETFETNFFNVIALTQTLLPLIRKSDAGRIVNLSSLLGSLTEHANPKSAIYNSKTFAYDASKTALNAFTVHLAHELKDTKIKVNSAHPGWVKTEMGGQEAPMEVSEGGKTSAELALLPEDGPTGGFFHRGQPIAW